MQITSAGATYQFVILRNTSAIQLSLYSYVQAIYLNQNISQTLQYNVRNLIFLQSNANNLTFSIEATGNTATSAIQLRFYFYYSILCFEYFTNAKIKVKLHSQLILARLRRTLTTFAPAVARLPFFNERAGNKAATIFCAQKLPPDDNAPPFRQVTNKKNKRLICASQSCKITGESYLYHPGGVSARQKTLADKPGLLDTTCQSPHHLIISTVLTPREYQLLQFCCLFHTQYMINDDKSCVSTVKVKIIINDCI